MLHLDTSTVVAFLRGNADVEREIASHADELAMSSIVLAELIYGAHISSRPVENLSDVGRFRSQVRLVEFDERSAEAYGLIRAQLRKKGLQTGEADALIAAIAIAHESPLVAHNTRHFENIDGLDLRDWVK